MESKETRDLGVTLNLIFMIRSGKRRVTEDLLCHTLAYISHEELAEADRADTEVKPALVNDLIKMIIRARVDSSFRELLLSYLDRYLGDYVRSAGNKWVVNEQGIEGFVRAKRLEDCSE